MRIPYIMLAFGCSLLIWHGMTLNAIVLGLLGISFFEGLAALLAAENRRKGGGK